jgi:hypothetical protein
MPRAKKKPSILDKAKELVLVLCIALLALAGGMIYQEIRVGKLETQVVTLTGAVQFLLMNPSRVPVPPGRNSL